MSAVWVAITLDRGVVQHVRIPVRVVVLSAADVFLGGAA